MTNKSCILNLKYINQESSNSMNRFILRKSFGNNILLFKKVYENIGLTINFTNNTPSYSVPTDITRIFRINPILKTVESNFTLKTTDRTDFNTSSGLANIEFKINNNNFDFDINQIIVTNDTIHINSHKGIVEKGISLTPFRRTLNAGDIRNSKNQNVSTDNFFKAPNQVSSQKNQYGWKKNAGSINEVNNGSYYSGNPTYVYDSSNYTKFKKLQEINRNIKDNTSFGGDKNDGSQHAYRRVRS
tara:strand:- start:511 stop:1242 length:732 start_codon:yes stop_codon:yes gene_type:complete